VGFALTWEQGAVLTTAMTVGSAAMTVSASARVRRIAPFAREATMIAGLYALWQLAGELSLVGTTHAYDRARKILHIEHDLHLPSETRVQDIVTSNSVVAQVANIYYATMHFGVLFVFLFWLFLRHRDRYRPVRRVLALTTLACLLIQLVPVAPPRLLPGFTDTAAKYGQSVYGHGFGDDSLSAMPSVHVAWAVLVGWTVWRIGAGPGRFLGPLHALVTIVVVVATANHFWADGIVAVAVLVLCAGLERAGSAAVLRLRNRTPTASLTGKGGDTEVVTGMPG
jgi:hypothetical protein